MEQKIIVCCHISLCVLWSNVQASTVTMCRKRYS